MKKLYPVAVFSMMPMMTLILCPYSQPASLVVSHFIIYIQTFQHVYIISGVYIIYPTSGFKNLLKLKCPKGCH